MTVRKPHSIRGAALVALAAAAAAATAASAHHAITLNYDPNTSGSIEGVVEEVFWANPHVHYYLTVTETDGSSRLWDMETGNLNVMRARGMTRDTIKIGDRVTVHGTLGRDGHPAILADAVVKEDGTVVWGNPEARPATENYGADQN